MQKCPNKKLQLYSSIEGEFREKEEREGGKGGEKTVQSGVKPCGL
jgi:hypothetical protein